MDRRESVEGPVMQGYLLKWANYMKGFQKRYFVLERGILSYYRSPEEMTSSCRGTMVLKDARIEKDVGCNFVVAQGERKNATTFHLRADSDRLRAVWIDALERAKLAFNAPLRSETPQPSAARADTPSRADTSKRGHVRKPSGSDTVSVNESISSESEAEASETDSPTDPAANRVLSGKLALIQKHHALLVKAIQSLKAKCDTLSAVTGVSDLNQSVIAVESAAGTLLNGSSDYLNEVFSQQKKWSKLFQLNETKRKQLEEQLEHLAKEQQMFERKASKVKTQLEEQNIQVQYGESGDEQFYDADETVDDTRDEAPIAPVRSRASTAKLKTEPSTAPISTTIEASTTVVATASDPVHSGAVTPRASASALAGATTVPQDHAATLMAKFKPRERIPYKPNKKMNLWSVMKNCIGKDLSKIPMPVHFNEPLSFTQRLAEDVEHAYLLDRAVKCETSAERMAWVAAFTMSSFASVVARTGKPFNPLLGETFELDHSYDLGYRVILEQVSHHPPICAMHAEHKDWIFWQDFSMSSKFRGKYLEIIPLGISHLIFKASGDHFTWTKVNTTVHNIIVGKLWAEQHGTMLITNHTNGDVGELVYHAYSYFSSAEARKVDGKVTTALGRVEYILEGNWDSHMQCYKPESPQALLELWRRPQLAQDFAKMYGFSGMCIELNEMRPIDQGCAPTDSRLRPDCRLMEDTEWEQANIVKGQLEEAQRKRRKRMEKDMETWSPVWFAAGRDPTDPSRTVHMYKGGYWECKAAQDWSRCPSIYEIDGSSTTTTASNA
eukprot:m.396451 g.396451  ORF g.396451 m.396451 type:complete len:783 (-) comp56410_c0_seq1:116-2464(-)